VGINSRQLARISHQLSAATQSGVYFLRSLTVLNILSKYASAR
jgi:hypothetical protein